MTKINMPQGAAYIIEQLNNNGFEAYIVGGCVRDSLLNKTPNDWDITTSATPGQVKAIFGRTVDTGIEHGTVTVIVDREHSGNFEAGNDVPYTFEVTTYRVDGEYKNHRKPCSVEFTASLSEDLKRRDFTINAMAYNDREGIVDIFGGAEDLNAGIIRAVGCASDRFDEDALRILRAERFAAQLGFEIEEETKKAMVEQAAFLKDISAERIQVELTKLIMSDNPGRLAEAYELGITGIILPEFDVMMETAQNNPYHMYNVGMHTVRVMENVPADMVLRYAALLHDVGKPGTKVTGEDGVDHFYGHQLLSADMARTILRRLKLDNNTIKRVCILVENHDFGIGNKVSPAKFRRFLNKIGKENAKDFFLIKRADIAGQSPLYRDKTLALVGRMEQIYDTTIREGHCITIKELAIGGSDLIELGMKPGREIGETLDRLLDKVLSDPSLNERDKLIKMI